MHVALVLRERHRRDADVVAALEKQRGASAAGVGDAVAVRRAADDAAADDLDLVLRLQELERRLDDRKRRARAAGQLGPGQLAGEVQRLEHELQDQVEPESGFLQRLRRSRKRNDFTVRQ